MHINTSVGGLICRGGAQVRLTLLMSSCQASPSGNLVSAGVGGLHSEHSGMGIHLLHRRHGMMCIVGLV